MDKLIEMKLDDVEDGVFAISIVSEPAIQSDFLALSDSKILLKVEDEEKKILTGAILIPNLPILRLDAENNPYHIFFSKDTVNEISQRYLKNKNQDQVTVEHKVDTDDVTLIESWIKTDDTHDKSVALGLDVPTGTWLGTMKVDNAELWDTFIKAGHLKGFSIEARMKAEEVSEIDNNLKQKKMEDKFLSHIKSFFSKEVETPEVEEKIEMASKEEYLDLCKKVDSLAEQLTALVEAKEEVELSPKKTSNDGRNPQTGGEETVQDEKPQEDEKKDASPLNEEVVEMVAHTDAETEEVKLEAPKFDYKATTEERIALALKKH